MYALLIYLGNDPALAGIRLGLLAVALAYLAISVRCWFIGPTGSMIIVVGLMGLGWWT